LVDRFPTGTIHKSAVNKNHTDRRRIARWHGGTPGVRGRDAGIFSRSREKSKERG
jgi:hypothetical protein